MWMFYLLVSLVHAEVPETLQELSKKTEKDNFEYQVLAYKAAIDTINVSNNELAGMNSAEALKVSSFGLMHMPYRGDIRDVRNKALNTYISITRKLEEKPKENCEVLKERYEFLAKIAPDSLTMVNNNLSCLKVVKLIEPKNAELISVKIPPVNPELEKDFKADLSHDVDFYLAKNNNFPTEDVLNNMFMLFSAIFPEDFSVECTALKVDPNSTNPKDLKVSGHCERITPTVANLAEVKKQYDLNIKTMFEVPGGKEKVLGLYDNSKIASTKPLVKKWECLMSDESHCQSPDGKLIYGVNKRLPECIVMSMNLIYEKKQKAKPFLAFMNHRFHINMEAGEKSLPVFGKRFGQLGFNLPFPDSELEGCFHPTRHDLQNEPMTYIDILRKNALTQDQAFGGLTIDQLKGLKKITFTINHWATYHYYRKYLFQLPDEITEHEQRGSAKAYEKED